MRGCATAGARSKAEQSTSQQSKTKRDGRGTETRDNVSLSPQQSLKKSLT